MSRRKEWAEENEEKGIGQCTGIERTNLLLLLRERDVKVFMDLIHWLGLGL